MSPSLSRLECPHADTFSEAYASLCGLVSLESGDGDVDLEGYLLRSGFSEHLACLTQHLRAQGAVEAKRRDVLDGVKALYTLEHLLESPELDTESECHLFAQAKIAQLWVVSILGMRPAQPREGVQSEALGQLTRIALAAANLAREIEAEEQPLQNIAEPTDLLRTQIASFFTVLIQGGYASVPVWLAREVIDLDLAIVRFQIDPEEHASELAEAISVLSCARPIS